MLVCPKHHHFIDGADIGYDTETTGISVWKGDRAFTYSFANLGGDTVCFEFDVDPHTRQVIPRPRVLDQIRRLMEDPYIRKIGFNTKFDNRMTTEGWGIPVLGRIEDVMWKAHVCNSTEMKYGLKPLCAKYGHDAGMNNDDEKALEVAVKAVRLAVKKIGWQIAKGATKGEDDKAFRADYWMPKALIRRGPKELVQSFLARWSDLGQLNRTYATLDAIRTIILDQFYNMVMDEEGLWPVYEREIRMYPVTYRTEKIGVRIFPERCEDVIRECNTNLVRLRASLSEIFGNFETEVPDDRVRKHLFSPPEDGGLGLKVVKQTKGGKDGKNKQPSVDRDVKEYYSHVPVVAELKLFDKYHKAKSHYVEKYVRHAIPEGGQLIIHADFKQIGPKTGRMACAEPPLQQTPKRAKTGEIMKRVRYPFGPRKGHVWLHNDFKSIEPRILAEEADEPDMIAEFARPGGDPYVVLVDRVARATRRSIDDLEMMFEDRGGARQVCKNNFLGWTYGEGVRKLAAQMGCSYEEAAEIIAALQSAFGGVGPFMKHVQAVAKREGCIWNRYGRKTMIPPPAWVIDEETGMWKRIEFWYKATNYLIQGTAADLLKEAAIRLAGEDHYYDRQNIRQTCKGGFLHGTGAEIVMMIHDELVVEVPYKLAGNERFVRRIADVMADNEGMFKKVATPVDTKVTWSAWSDPEDVETLWGACKENELVEI